MDDDIISIHWFISIKGIQLGILLLNQSSKGLIKGKISSRPRERVFKAEVPLFVQNEAPHAGGANIQGEYESG